MSLSSRPTNGQRTPHADAARLDTKGYETVEADPSALPPRPSIVMRVGHAGYKPPRHSARFDGVAKRRVAGLLRRPAVEPIGVYRRAHCPRSVSLCLWFAVVDVNRA
ncbi:MAG: hypothetical protein DMG00_12560 [Acidobacteria bacterium]|nr:MAG: hypothetical protein DMG00_12560 [Acidobacteriota bacterium]